MKIPTLVLAAALSMAGSFSFAASHEASEGAMKPLMVPMEKLMAKMPMPSTGNPDADFLMMMIPHHKSAMEMAQVEMEMGTDDATKDMAKKIFDAQKKEIEELRKLLEAMGVEPPPVE